MTEKPVEPPAAGRRVEPLVGRRPFLTDFVRQDATKDPSEPESAIAYLVFDLDGNDRLFSEFDDAANFAQDQIERSEAKKPWGVFPLYAGHPIEAD